MQNSTAQTIAGAATMKTGLEDSPDFIRNDERPMVILLKMGSPLHKRSNRFIKRIFDLFFSVLLLVPFLILLPIIALLIKTGSRGPVFFLQKRNKKNGQVFRCIKFRTMTVNKEADLHPAKVDDHRITSVGLFLRKYHLDELPQLLNVWWGDMSIIGPRPHMISDNKRFDSMMAGYNARHTVKPGITGLAQVLGYVGPVNEVQDIRERVRNDMFYICNWSAMLEIRIVWRSFLHLAGKRKPRPFTL